MGILEEQLLALDNLRNLFATIKRQIALIQTKQSAPIWVKLDFIMQAYSLSRQPAQFLIFNGAREGLVKILLFRVRGQSPMLRIDLLSFDEYLKNGGFKPHNH